MKVAGIQMDIAWERPEENFRRADPLLERAAAEGAHADAVRAFLADRARRLGIRLLGGYAEPGERRPMNACSIYGPDGAEILHYRKIHPFTLAAEHEHYDGGDALPTAEIEGVRVTPLICYDLRFPEPFRAAAAETDLFVVIANWPERRADAWRALGRARAIENQAFLLAVNRVGEGGGADHSGDSALYDPFGHGETAPAGEVAIVPGDADPAAVADARRRFSFLADRRPEVYRGLR